MLYREISEMLRNPNGAYFQEGTPAMLALETMVDTVGINNVLYALAHIASEKADHVLSSYDDRTTASVWVKRANRFHALAGQSVMHD